MTFQRYVLLVLLSAAFCLPAYTLNAQSGKDLLAEFEPTEHAVSGNWKKTGELVHVDQGRASKAMLPPVVQGSYSLTVEFTRLAGQDSVGVILPVGERSCIMNLSAFKGEAHGIALVDNKIARDNSTTIKPGKLENDHAYRLLIEVDVKGDQATIASQLDGKPFLRWRGNPQSLSLLDFWALPRKNRIGLVTFSEVAFHRVQLRKLDPTMRMTRAFAATKAVDKPKSKETRFQGFDWIGTNAEQVAVETFQGEPALHVQGKEPSFVYLADKTFGDGVIEVEIASSTFSGIGFRGSAKGTVAEKVYFRPFNSGTAKHENTVQYSMLGRPENGWRSLREKFPGKYEAGARIEKDQWFHVRLVIRGERVEAFVDKDAKPVLVVDKMLGDNERGTLGVWGWDSYFRNFKFTPVD